MSMTNLSLSIRLKGTNITSKEENLGSQFFQCSNTKVLEIDSNIIKGKIKELNADVCQTIVLI